MALLHSTDAIRTVLADARNIAVLGAHWQVERAAYYVPAYLAAHGFCVIPVNPTLVGRSLWGRPVLATLAEVEEPMDLVNVFRPAHTLAGHLPDLLAMSPLPRCVWLQLGIRDDSLAATLVSHGIDVVQDRCTLADHRDFVSERVP